MGIRHSKRVTTREIAEWASTLRYDDIPERVHAKSKAQILSVLGAIHAGRHSEGAVSANEIVRTWGAGEEATVFMTGERLPRHNAIYFVNDAGTGSAANSLQLLH